MYNILVVEDELKIAQTVMDYLRREGYAVLHAATIAEALKLVSSDIDLIVLDLMLPDGQGEDLCAHVVGLYNTPVIMLTSKRSEQSRINGFASGADDYLAKPFDLDELLARIEVQLRHRARVPAPQPGGDVLRVGAWTVDRAARTLAVDGADVPLTRTEFNIVELLALHPKKVYTKQELFELAWGEPYAAEDSTVSVHVSNIRAKLKPTGTDGYLCTVWGLGFKLAVDEGA